MSPLLKVVWLVVNVQRAFAGQRVESGHVAGGTLGPVVPGPGVCQASPRASLPRGRHVTLAENAGGYRRGTD